MKTTKWIKRSDYLPVNYEALPILVATKTHILFASYDKNIGFFTTDNKSFDLSEVKYWMPIPLPPDEQS